MSDVFPAPPDSPEGGPAPMGYVDPTLRQDLLRRWEARAVQWRAAALAELVFEGPVVPRLAARAGGGGFRAMIELEVPFDDLDSHRDAEVRFLAAAGRDELLGGLPLVVLFAARPRHVPVV